MEVDAFRRITLADIPGLTDGTDSEAAIHP